MVTESKGKLVEDGRNSTSEKWQPIYRPHLCNETLRNNSPLVAQCSPHIGNQRRTNEIFMLQSDMQQELLRVTTELELHPS